MKLKRNSDFTKNQMRKKPIVRIRTKLKGRTNLMATMKF